LLTSTDQPAAPPLWRRLLLRFLALVSGAVAAVFLAVVVVTPLPGRIQSIFGAVVFLLALVLTRVNGRFVTLTLVTLSITVSTRYLYWRLTSTLAFEWSLDAALGAILLSAELYAYLVLVLGYFQILEPLKRRPIPLPEDPSTWPTVDIYIPTYNEPLSVVRATVLAARAMDWPSEKLTVYLLDDGRRPEFRSFAAQAGVSYIIRPDNKHAKAGNLNHALAHTQGEFVAIFDCDHIPTRAFLQMTMGMLVEDKGLAMVQTPHHFYSPDPFERNLKAFRSLPNESELFYGLIQPGNDLWNASFFCGSCAVLRRSALDTVGGIAVDTVTEDAHTMLRLHRKGWRSAYLPLTLAAGLATESMSAHIGQRIRWARGMAQIFRVDNPLFGRGLTFAQRLCYLSAMVHFFFGIPRMIFLLSPLSFLLFDAQIFNALPLVVVTYALPHLVHSILTNSRMQRSYRHSFWSDVYESALAWYVAIPTTVALIAPRLGTFNVTAKGGLVVRRFFSGRIALPYALMCVANLIGLAAAIYRLVVGMGATDVVVINLTWTCYNLLILGVTLAAAWEERQMRVAPRVAVTLPAMIRLEGGNTLRCRTKDVSMTGASLTLAHADTIAAGAPVSVSILTENEERPLPAVVVEHKLGQALRVRFQELSLEQESWLVQATFCRADAWSSWSAGRKPDFALRALRDLLFHAVRAFYLALAPRPKVAGPPEAGK
jgi:cellulose synthase (UDP-forming)